MMSTVSKRTVYFLLGLVTVTTGLAQDRPNILWITCEDLSPHLGCYGDRAAPTPHIDALAAEGVRYTLMAQLRADGLLDKTIVFFYSDHGNGLPRCKRWVCDSGTRVPLIVRFPDRRDAGTTCDRLVSFVDFGPTVLSLAGVDVPPHVHGRAFLGAQAGRAREYVFFHRDRNGENRETIRAIRDQRYRYVRNFRPASVEIKYHLCNAGGMFGIS